MTQKTLDEKDVEEPSIWSDGSFAETLGPDDTKTKMRTFHMKQTDEEKTKFLNKVLTEKDGMYRLDFS